MTALAIVAMLGGIDDLDRAVTTGTLKCQRADKDNGSVIGRLEISQRVSQNLTAFRTTWADDLPLYAVVPRIVFERKSFCVKSVETRRCMFKHLANQSLIRGAVFGVLKIVFGEFHKNISLPDNLDQHPLPPAAIKLVIKDMLPRTEVQIPLSNRNNNFAAHDLAFVVGVGVG
jgi:hypothetical protein